MQQTFTDFKKDFYVRVPDLTLFDCGDINLLKVVLDGLKVKYTEKGKVRSYLFYSNAMYQLFIFIKRIITNNNSNNVIKKIIKQNSEAEIFIHEINRYINNDENKSVYFKKITDDLISKNKKLVTVYDGEKPNNRALSITDIEQLFLYVALNKEEKKIKSNIKKCYLSIQSSNIFTEQELKNIKYAFHKFFHEFKIWNRFFNHLSNCEKAIFICHYHKEGEIYALQKNKIKTIELQHGLIAKQDIFYVFPQATKNIIYKCLFADKIKVFGAHWKKTLLLGTEYNEHQIDVLGYYLYEEDVIDQNEIRALIKDKNTVVVTTQTFMHNEFIAFIKKLAINSCILGNDLFILVKPHPSENKKIYEDAFLNYQNVQVVTIPTNILFKNIKQHISVYSTTLYDALRFDVTNYVFKVDYCEDYTNEIINTGIANLIDIESNKIVYGNHKTEESSFYSSYNTELIFS